MHIVAIVEVRMTSSRLPGKHLMEVNGKPMLQYLVDRLKRVPLLDEIVIATTVNQSDDVLVAFAEQAGVDVYRGDEDDVMGRVVEAGAEFSADVICEVTGDCPVIDPDLVEQVIQTFVVNNVDYVNNGKFGLPAGMGAQVFSWKALKKSSEMTVAPLDREHVTYHMKRHPELFSSIYLIADKVNYCPSLGVTLDVEDDYQFLKKIIEYFGDNNPYFKCSEIISLIREKPDWLEINGHVERKGYS